ncbi:MAG: DUF2490 domain-containing protein [Candidatus Omnitrophica bacterium]|nr:DUF2490 domain-containing protein [Candidatus Omnitrophota bacterium]
MKRTYYFIVCFFLFLFFNNFVFSFDDGDFQYWSAASASVKINEKLKLSFEEESRFADDADQYYYQHYDLGLAWSGLAKWLELGASYRHIYEKSKEEWYQENRPHLNVTARANIFDFGLSNRIRFEYRNRHKDKAEDYWRLRNKFTVRLPLKITKFEIQPYVADEIYYDYNVEGINRNRVYAGFSFKIIKNLNGDIYYLWQSSEGAGKWEDINIFGTNIKYSF